MRSASCIAVLASAFWMSACGGPVSSRAVREQLATLGGAGLSTDDVRVERIITQAGGQVVAEATVQMAVLMEEDPEGEWTITAVRVGEDEWVDMDTFLRALDERRIEDTTSNLRMLATGIEAYERANGTLPDVSEALPLPDLLHPLFVPDLVRQDAWGSDFIYEAADNRALIRSPGPDREPGTPDDIEVSAAQRP